MQTAMRVSKATASNAVARRSQVSRVGARVCIPIRSSRVSATAADLEATKEALMDAVASTRRGSAATMEQRGIIEELQVTLEVLQGVRELDYSKLDGLFELIYTTADDLVPVIDAENILRPPVRLLPPPIKVGNIYQRFHAPVNGVGKLEHIIEFSVPFFTEDRDGIRLWVDAAYVVRSGNRIRLQFNKANLSNIRLSSLAQSLLAPSSMPRNALQDTILNSIRDFRWELPLRSAERVANGVEDMSGEAGSGGGAYVITYMDEDLLLCRASEMRGIYLLKRVPETQLVPSSASAAGAAAPLSRAYVTA